MEAEKRGERLEEGARSGQGVRGGVRTRGVGGKADFGTQNDSKIHSLEILIFRSEVPLPPSLTPPLTPLDFGGLAK